MNNVGLAFLMTLLAGLATGGGSVIAFFAKRTNEKFLSVSLGFSAGVMIYVSMVEIFQEAMNGLQSELGTRMGAIATVAAFFGGMFVIAIIDKLIPEDENPHEIKHPEDESVPVDPDELAAQKNKGLKRIGLFTALAIAIHNFPEGLATFVSALNEPTVAIPIVVAIAIHNIPEGVAVSVPIYHATGSKKQAFWLSFASGLSEPLGALIGYMILMPFMTEALNGIVFSAVAGIMVFISFDELLPTAEEYGEHHLAIYGLIAGMVVMAVSLILFM